MQSGPARRAARCRTSKVLGFFGSRVRFSSRALTGARGRARARVEDALLGLEDELAALDLRHAALLRAADEQAACGDGEPACTVRPPARARARARTGPPSAAAATGVARGLGGTSVCSGWCLPALARARDNGMREPRKRVVHGRHNAQAALWQQREAQAAESA